MSETLSGAVYAIHLTNLITGGERPVAERQHKVFGKGNVANAKAAHDRGELIGYIQLKDAEAQVNWIAMLLEQHGSHIKELSDLF